MRIGMAGQQPHRRLQRGDCAGHVVGKPARRAEVVIGFGVVRLQLDRRFKLIGGGAQFAARGERIAEIEVRLRQISVQPNGFTKLGHHGVGNAALLEGETEHQVRLGLVGFNRQRLSKRVDRPIHVAELLKRLAEIAVRFIKFRVERAGFAE